MAGTGKLSEGTIQSAVFEMELGRARKVVQWFVVVLAAVAMGLWYSAVQFRGLEKREAMDMAQLARHIAHGEGFTTSVIRPLGLWQLEHHGWAKDDKRLLLQHPDTYNPPLYPWAIAALFKLLPAEQFEYKSSDRVYAPERWVILPFNQVCLLLSLLLVYHWAKELFDRRVAITAGLLLLFSDTMWSYGISGLPTNLLLLLFLLALYCLYRADRRLNPAEAGAGEPAAAPQPPVLTVMTVVLIVASALLMGLCFLTRYLSAFLVVPMALYVAWIVRGRRGAVLAIVYVVVFAAVITPWLARNYGLTGNLLGLARYELIDRYEHFTGDTLQRSYRPDKELAETNYLKLIATKLLTGTRTHVFDSLKKIGDDFLVFFFVAGLLYGFRRRDTARLRGVILCGLACAILGMSLIGSPEERVNPGVNGGNLLVLFLPLMAVYGVAFFYLLLDRIPFSIRLTRAAAIGAFVLLNIAAIILTLLPPRRGLFPYPPYLPPIARMAANWFEKDELGVSDAPWEMAWFGGRRTLWLPTSVEDFYEINDYTAPTPNGFSFLLLTPYMLDRSYQETLLAGEYKAWAGLVHDRAPSGFPLKVSTPLPPNDEHLLFADKVRWPIKPTTR